MRYFTHEFATALIVQAAAEQLADESDVAADARPTKSALAAARAAARRTLDDDQKDAVREVIGAQTYANDVLTQIGAHLAVRPGHRRRDGRRPARRGPASCSRDVGRRQRRRDQPEVRHRVRHAGAGRHRPVLRARQDREGRAEPPSRTTPTPPRCPTTSSASTDVTARASGEPLLEFLAVMRRLRAECPWKREQTHRSLARYLLEETHETLEAIDTGDRRLDHLREELGDLLLQVYFHAVIAEEAGAFTIDDVARGITEKMYRRNPHVFGPPSDDQPQDAAAVNEVWQAIKERDKPRDLAHRRPARHPARAAVRRQGGRAAARRRPPAPPEPRRPAARPGRRGASPRASTPSRPCATPYAGGDGVSAGRGCQRAATCSRPPSWSRSSPIRSSSPCRPSGSSCCQAEASAPPSIHSRHCRGRGTARRYGRPLGAYAAGAGRAEERLTPASWRSASGIAVGPGPGPDPARAGRAYSSKTSSTAATWAARGGTSSPRPGLRHQQPRQRRSAASGSGRKKRTSEEATTSQEPTGGWLAASPTVTSTGGARRPRGAGARPSPGRCRRRGPARSVPPPAPGAPSRRRGPPPPRAPVRRLPGRDGRPGPRRSCRRTAPRSGRRPVRRRRTRRPSPGGPPGRPGPGPSLMAAVSPLAQRTGLRRSGAARH